jgi:hypothetical protein
MRPATALVHPASSRQSCLQTIPEENIMATYASGYFAHAVNTVKSAFSAHVPGPRSARPGTKPHRATVDHATGRACAAPEIRDPFRKV